MDKASSICPTCGNIMQNGVCRRCRANEATRAKKWRTGDHGGKRPERTVTQPPFAATKSSLSQALNGTWRSMQRGVTITINTRTRTYRSNHPQKPVETAHRFRLESENGRELRFMRDDVPVDVHVDDAGIVRMKTGKMELGFLYLDDEVELRTCPVCFAKTPTSVGYCDNCDWSFGITFG